jgi:hypothetical protein
MMNKNNIWMDIYNNKPSLFEGVKIEPLGRNGSNLLPGDSYIAGRSKLKLLTVLETNVLKNFIVPKEEGEYWHDCCECLGVNISLD